MTCPHTMFHPDLRSGIPERRLRGFPYRPANSSHNLPMEMPQLQAAFMAPAMDYQCYIFH